MRSCGFTLICTARIACIMIIRRSRLITPRASEIQGPEIEMTYAVFEIKTQRIAQDKDGHPHTYSTREQAENVCDDLNAGDYSDAALKADNKYVVKPV
jgi:hypothetical protein